MPKRKREDISSEDRLSNDSSDRALRLQRQQLEALLEEGKKSLSRALKVARGFERQKLGRRQKTAKAENSEANTARLETEIAALKSFDLAVTAELHLYKSLLKINSIASAPSFPRYVQTTVEAARKPLDSPIANVQARLFSSGPVQAAMLETLDRIRRTLGIEETRAATKKKRLRAKDYANATPAQEGVEPTVSRNKKTSTGVDLDSKPWDGLSDQDVGGKEQYGTDGASEEEGYGIYASRLAASSDEDSMSGASASDNGRLGELNPERVTESDSESEPEGSYMITKPKTAKKASSTAAPKSTTFLPSLSMGGYWSGSESAEGLSDTEPQGRKNRMGQQARRALWEKKFGKNANHVRKQPQDRDEGWDARRGASAGDDRGKRGRGRGGFSAESGRRRGSGGRGPMSSGANSDPISARKMKPKPAAGALLHPSWEAAKKAKEQKTTVAFQGKKVVFD